MTVVPVGGGPVAVRLRDPAGGGVVGEWDFAGGGATLVIDFDDGVPRCLVDGNGADRCGVAQGFISYPRMTFEVNGSPVEVVAEDPEVLRRHYGRPQHMDSYTQPDTWIETFHRARVAQARRLLSGVHGKVLDVGSGQSLVRMAGPWDFDLVACDWDREAVASMRGERERAIVSGVEQLPARAGAFDAVYAGEIVEHLLDPDAALREWTRALKPGGRLVVTTPNRRHLMARLSGHEAVVNPEHLFEYSLPELVAAVERNGGRVVRAEGLTLAVPVWVPRRGLRNLARTVHNRRQLPARALRVIHGLGGPFPSLADNLAVVATPDRGQ